MTAWLAPAIGGVFGLLKGAADRRAMQAANAANSPAGQVAAWERAGINPAFGISQGNFIPQQAVSMGDAFASAGSALSRVFELNHEEALERSAVQRENSELKKALARSTSENNTPTVMERLTSGRSAPGASAMAPGSGNVQAPTGALPSVFNSGGGVVPAPGIDYGEGLHTVLPGQTLPRVPPATNLFTASTSWRAFGVDMLPNPWFSDAEAGEARGAEVTSNLLGGVNTFLDPAYTFGVHVQENSRRSDPPIDGYRPPRVEYVPPGGRPVSSRRPVPNPYGSNPGGTFGGFRMEADQALHDMIFN